MMREAIKNFTTQFEFEPRIEHGASLAGKHFRRLAVAGMGGSNLAADLLTLRQPALDIIVHRDYGLPGILNGEVDPTQTLVIASSYSGNTEETLDSYREAKKRHLSLAAISTGGELLAEADQDKTPFIRMPATGIQPRSALGFSLVSFLKLLGEADALAEIHALAKTFRPLQFEASGRELAEKIKGRVPVIYASARNRGIAYNWKIKFNESGKIPAFYNVLPELNHNEMTGFEIDDTTRALSDKFIFIFLKDGADDPRIQKRMTVLAGLYAARKLPVAVLEIPSGNIFERIFSSLILADWTALFIAEGYDVDPEQIPLVEEFKKLISSD